MAQNLASSELLNLWRSRYERACVSVDVLCLNFFFNLYLCGRITCSREMMSIRWFSAGPRSSLAIVALARRTHYGKRGK